MEKRNVLNIMLQNFLLSDKNIINLLSIKNLSENDISRYSEKI